MRQVEPALFRQHIFLQPQDFRLFAQKRARLVRDRRIGGRFVHGYPDRRGFRRCAAARVCVLFFSHATPRTSLPLPYFWGAGSGSVDRRLG